MIYFQLFLLNKFYQNNREKTNYYKNFISTIKSIFSKDQKKAIRKIFTEKNFAFESKFLKIYF